jgi:hypothetical protein
MGMVRVKVVPAGTDLTRSVPPWATASSPRLRGHARHRGEVHPRGFAYHFKDRGHRGHATDGLDVNCD